MKKIGISIYPSKSEKTRDVLYITKAARFGFSRLFISLLEITGNQEQILADFKEIIAVAKENHFEVILDVSPAIFKQLQISYSDLAFFYELGADGIRLDLGFSGVEEAEMTHNPYDLLIEINMSHGTNYLENIISRQPRTGYLIGSHNFYPHAFTGLDYDYFLSCNDKFRKQNIPTAAFINAPSGTFGPWPMEEGICTVEAHRPLSIETQAAHLLFLKSIDCVIIGNAYASDKELAAVSKIFQMRTIPIRVKLANKLSEIEKEIVLNHTHIYRGEVTPFVYRTKSDGRKRYADQSVQPNNTDNIRKGDILIDNDLYLQYKGELQIAKKDRLADEKVNVVGKVLEEDWLLLETMQPWTSFHLEEV
ncbi:DUF871 domain-containing protein [Enterococcus sp. HY326]|uniref:DUF871 domain-containing protein n=1 Tax=Enterococcus sp. HY326 TaxID=2971265 RepID=UPI00223EAED6|nr:MupG family TIM beta-alpha barrel fold protein [Enterococcus sp. HY326]